MAAKKIMGGKSKKNSKKKEVEPPELSAVDDSASEEDEEVSVYDSEDEIPHGSDDDESEEDDSDDESDDNEEEDFEDQGSSDEDEDLLEDQLKHDSDEDTDAGIDIVEDIDEAYDTAPRAWKRTVQGSNKPKVKDSESQKKETEWMHTDNLSSDDEDDDGANNRIGRVPLHWYDEYDHIGYDAHGEKVVKTASAKGEGGDRLDQAIAQSDNKSQGKFTVHDALNDKDITLTERQLELIRRVQGGAYAHPEFNAHPDYVDYFSGVNKEISGINDNRYEPKHRFQPSKWDKLQVRRLLDKLEKGHINMDYLTGKVRDMNDVKKKNKDDPEKPFMIWQGDEEDELAMRKGAQHIAAPKLPPPGHAESYVPPDEYLPTEEDLKEWEEMEVKDRPHGLLVPKKHPNLRSVGAYQHSVREAFERCLDLYLCPRVMKRRLNIDPESLVPHLPKASDLRPFPTVKCLEYKTPYEKSDTPPVIRCVSPSPDGQFMASAATDGYVRLWEVQTGRLLQSWNVSKIIAPVDDNDDDNADANVESDDDTSSSNIKPVVSLEWNPNRNHHCLIAAAGRCAVVIATGTSGEQDSEITDALLSEAASHSKDGSALKTKAVRWISIAKTAKKSHKTKPISAFGGYAGPVSILRTNREMSSVKWHRKGDYFVTVSPKAGAAAVLIHQLSKMNTQQPFRKTKGEVQLACFHPNKPFLFVASQQHVRIYHLVKQAMVKRLVSGCRWISSMDVHSSGDHLIVGSLDRRMVWFDLDLSSTPYKTLKYHERALRSVGYHGRHPLMASASDDGAVHVFHSMVYSDLMRNPLLVPVKILRGHSIENKLGVLTLAFHPSQPWLFTGGADGRIFLFQDI